MDAIRFFFWESIKTLSLALLGVAAVKAIRALPSGRAMSGLRFVPDSQGISKSSRQRYATGIALAAIVLLVCLGARGIGNDLAAELYFRASRDDLAHNQARNAYQNALRAVKLRAGQVKYWQMLSTTKLGLHQYESMLADRAALESLQGGRLSEQDSMRFGFGYFFLAQYDEAAALAREVIQNNRFYAAPYVLLGMAYTAEKKYTDAERTFLEVLQMYPNQEGAVEGLAHVYLLMGQPGRSIAVLNESAKFQFSLAARERFAELKALYQQALTENAEVRLTRKQPAAGRR